MRERGALGSGYVVEKVLPEGALCMATAWGMGHKVFGYGPTPQAALSALAAKLREVAPK